MTYARPLLLLLIALLVATPGCAVVQQNEIGVKRTNGKLQEDTLGPGRYYVGPLSRMLKLPANIVNLEIQLDLPSQEGLSVGSDISILYRINPDKAHTVLSTAGPDYESSLILSSFRSASADVCAKFMAKDMHSGARSTIESQIQERMTELLGERGFIIEAVLLKSIRLPVGLSQSIEERLSAEQDSMRMKFVLEQERQEAERKMIEAVGERDANKIMNEELSEPILRMRAIEAFLMLSESPNAKVIITTPHAPMHMNLEVEPDPPLAP